MASTGAAANAVIIIGAVLLLCSLHIDAKPRYNDVDNCGKCKHKCPRAPPHSERTCKNGKCGTKCKRGWLDCDQKKANGCEVDVKSLKADVKNCGSCGNVCPVPLSNQFGTGVATCTKGVCGHTLTCATGFADCDGDPSNGCELDVKSNVNNCGSCGSVCPTGQLGQLATCTDGMCGLESTCAKDFEDCDSDPSNGCESDVRSDVKNCGSCGKVCPVPLTNHGSGEATCTDGVCGYTLTCAKDWADCDGDPSNGCEIDLAGIFSSIYNCGSCNHVCPPFQNSTIWSICDAGVCGYECNFFLGNLGNCDNDVSNGCETNLGSNDVNNCGGCGQVCTTPPRGQIACNRGVCTGNCLKGFYENCDRNPTNGCETSVWSDVNHCGSCGNVCPSPPNATPSCSFNTCKFTCNAGFSDCDLVASNGCEVHGVCPL
ncbi:hypothetical protein M758_1G294800 [Ceratodon purpureus]|nr:hypothetical protein M758_1G294800 [Ceratodon purpureus]